MSTTIDAVLAQALSDLDRGEDVMTCLSRYPSHAAYLAPLLRVAAYVRQVFAYVEPPSPVALAAGRRRILAEAARQWAAPMPWWQRLSLRLPFLVLSRGFATAALIAAVLVVVGTGVTVVAAGSLPGDPLYPVKLASEEARLALTFDAGTRAQLETEFAQARRDEAAAVQATGRRAPVHFQGKLEQFDPQRWVVDGLALQVSADTVVEGKPVIGAIVAVDAIAPGDGTLHANRLWVMHTPDLSGAVPTRAPDPTATPSLMPTLMLAPTLAPRPMETSPGSMERIGPDSRIRVPMHFTSTPRPTLPPANPPGMGPGPETPRPGGNPGSPPTAMPEMPGGPMMTPFPTEPSGPQPGPNPMMTPGPRMTSMPMPTYQAQPTSAPTQAPAPTHEPEPTSMPGPTHQPMPTHQAGMSTPRPHGTPRR